MKTWIPIVGFLAFVGWLSRQPLYVAKLRGVIPECSWKSIISSDSAQRHLAERIAQVRQTAKKDASEGDLDHVTSTGTRPFWVQRSRDSASEAFIAYLVGDHETIADLYPRQHVKRGDVVLDVGAHCGTFTDLALRRGASRVIAVEPDPISVESLRRNFAAEIADGRVIVVPEGAWSSDSTMALGRGALNSGSNSVVMRDGGWTGPTINVPLTTIDKMLARLNVEKLDFVKMDIEGAEREAIKGMAQSIERFHPRFMLDSYHRVDDMPTFRALLTGYKYTCGYCERPDDEHNKAFVPHVTFWQHRQ